jgi:hypothetical protein
MAATIASATISVTTTAPLASVVTKLTESNLTVESSHKYEVDNNSKNDFFAINGYDYNEDDSSDEESNDDDEENNADQHQYLITLPIFDALSAVVLLKGAEVVDGGMMHLISNVKFAYNKQFGYKIGNDNNARLSYFNFLGKNYTIQIWVSKKNTIKLNPGRSPFQTEDDDITRAVGIMLAIRHEYTKEQLSSLTIDALKTTINTIPTEFFRITEHGYNPSAWNCIRNFYTTEGLNILEILDESINAIDDLSTSSENQDVDLLAGLIVTDRLSLLEEFDGMKEVFGEIMAAATTQSNTAADIDLAKQPYGKMIGINQQISRSTIATIPSLIDADNVKANFNDQHDAAIYTTAGNRKNSNWHNLFDTVPNLSYKSHAIDLFLSKCASKKVWSTFMVERGIKEILDHEEPGQLWVFTQNDDRANGVHYSATIMDRDDILSECDKNYKINTVYKYKRKKYLENAAAAAAAAAAATDAEEAAAATDAEEESDT